ncbi:hypothetical protein BpHYR1_028447 [Brachionus plicatilis]|uniref:Uncharacterized protein n=1 Tax=Brachionus plicatilis TaxID=10195 RepID=A0A3M7QCD7_BRAPC|nr:hypothetical protein BpHYR1_028447 [Brachionus plicatilis]
MNSHSHIKVFLSRSKLESDRIALGHLASIWSCHMESNDPHVITNLGIAHIMGFVGDGPFKWPKIGVIHFNVVFAKCRNSLFFGVSDSTVLNWGKDSSRHCVVVHFDIAFAKNSVCQQLTSFDSYRCKF